MGEPQIAVAFVTELAGEELAIYISNILEPGPNKARQNFKIGFTGRTHPYFENEGQWSMRSPSPDLSDIISAISGHRAGTSFRPRIGPYGADVTGSPAAKEALNKALMEILKDG